MDPNQNKNHYFRLNPENDQQSPENQPNKSSKFKLTRRHKRWILNSIGVFTLAFILIISFVETPKQWLRGQLNIRPQEVIDPITGEPKTEAKPDMQIWKLTYLPSAAPEGTVITPERIITEDTANYQDLMDIAIEATTDAAEIRQLAFEVDLDDDESVLSEEEQKSLNSLDYLALFTDTGNKLAQAKFQKEGNQVVAIFKFPGIQLEKSEIASLKIKAMPVPGFQQNTHIRLQLILTQTFATKADGSEAIIFADLGKNNNGNIKDDFVASDLIKVQ